MELRQFRYLDAVARRRSFTKAALDLHVAQSALSQQVGRLERELGVELLRRTTRRVEVTEAGELVLARARRALAEVDGVRADLDALQGLARGTLRLGGAPPVGPLHPAALIADFTRAHPGVAITVREDVAFTLLAQLRDRALDLVLALVDPGDLDGLGVTLIPRSVVASHGDRLAIRPLSPRQALPVSLVWRAGERPTPAVHAFREHVLST